MVFIHYLFYLSVDDCKTKLLAPPKDFAVTGLTSYRQTYMFVKKFSLLPV